jgi:hypothetical protein
MTRYSRLSSSVAVLVIGSMVSAAAQQPLQTTSVRAPQDNPPAQLSGLETAVVGTAYTADRRPLANAQVRLRSVLTGLVIGLRFTNEAGNFTYAGLDAGTYVAELLDDDGDVVDTGDVITLERGQTAETNLQLPERDRKLLYYSLGGAALAAALGAGIVAYQSNGRNGTSPER